MLDEADKMMDAGMRNDVDYIVNKLPKNKQTICCSATFPPAVEKIVCSCMRDPHKVVSALIFVQ